ncbi:MAG TPA: glycosyltransferase [Dehalococcoidia bacterium]|nr:glycosyltransferase [Dehalococcoidia bacterium]
MDYVSKTADPSCPQPAGAPAARVRLAHPLTTLETAPPAQQGSRAEAVVHAAALLALLVAGAYVVWRVGWTVNGSALWLSLPLLVAEIHGFFTYAGYMFMTWKPVRFVAPPPIENATVDFLIPTYNEPFAVLAPTIAGAVAVTYPHRTYVLDDGKRDWVRRLCKRLGAEYLTRPTNEGAKAGNLNHALARTSGEFVAVIDADFVPKPSFIDDMLGYFRDPKVAFVQGPQEFYNRDSFQHASGDHDAWHEQSLFFRTIQPGKNRWNAAFWCGCPSLLRRRALECVGGVAQETVTEDLHTSMKLHAAGWKSVYHPSPVALGIAPNDYDGFVLQRLRWAEGTMQVIRREWRLRGLTFAQGVNYLASTSTYFDAIRKAVFLSILPLVLITDQLPIQAPGSVFLPFWAAQFLSVAVANSLLGRGNNRYLMTEFFDLLKMFAFIKASMTLLTGKRVRFRVTPKGAAPGRGVHGLLAPYAALLVAYALSMGVGLLRIEGVFLQTRHETVQFAALIWASAIMAALGAVIWYGYRKVSQRSADRVMASVNGTYRRRYGTRTQPILLQDLTTMGCAFVTSSPPPVGCDIRIDIGQGRYVLRGRVRRVRKLAGAYEVGVSLHMGEAGRTRVAQLIAASMFAAGEAPPAGATPVPPRAEPSRAAA